MFFLSTLGQTRCARQGDRGRLGSDCPTKKEAAARTIATLEVIVYCAVCIADNVDFFLPRTAVELDLSEDSILPKEFIEEDEELSLPGKWSIQSWEFARRSHGGQAYLHSGMIELVGVHLTEMVVVSV